MILADGHGSTLVLDHGDSRVAACIVVGENLSDQRHSAFLGRHVLELVVVVVGQAMGRLAGHWVLHSAEPLTHTGRKKVVVQKVVDHIAAHTQVIDNNNIYIESVSPVNQPKPPLSRLLLCRRQSGS